MADKIERDALRAIIERRLEQINEIVGFDPVESVEPLYHTDAEILDTGSFRPTDRSVRLAAEFIEKAAEEGGEWHDAIMGIAFHEWGHAFVYTCGANLADLPVPDLTLIKPVVVPYPELSRSEMEDAVRRLLDAGAFEWGDLESLSGDPVTTIDEFLDEAETIVEAQVDEGDKLGHSLGDSIGRHFSGVTREMWSQKTIELANELGLISVVGANRKDPQHMQRLEEAKEAPTATKLRVQAPTVDSKGNDIIVETDEMTLMEPPRESLLLKLHKMRVGEGVKITIPNLNQEDPGTFEALVTEVLPESGARVDSDETEVEWEFR